MNENVDFYNRLEFTLSSTQADFDEFGRDVLELLKKYQGYLIGYDLENLKKDEYVCYDATIEEAETAIRKIFKVS